MEELKIKPQDLRIGNWVQFGGVPMKVVLIQQQSVAIGTEDNNFSASYDEIGPIPLTDEIMAKCGFYVEKAYGLWQHYYYNVNVLIMRLSDEYPYEHSWINYDTLLEMPLIDCRYMHELQNSFVAITGQELYIKKPEGIRQAG